MRISSLVKTIGSGILHLVAFVIIAAVFLPVANWYFLHRPILGVDFFNTVTHARTLLEEFSLPLWGYKYFWFGGSAFYLDVAMGWFYPISLVARFFPLLSAVKIAVLGGFLALVVFVYLAAYRLSRHHLFSAIIAMLVVYSANMYGSLTWGGSLPYFANQLFFPATLWLVASYIDTGKKQWYWLAIFFLGVAFLGHAQNAGSFAFPGAVALLIFGSRVKRVKFKERIGEVLLLFFGAMLLSFRVGRVILGAIMDTFRMGRIIPQFGQFESRVQFIDGEISVVGNEGIISYERSRFAILFSETNSWFYALIGLAFAVLIVAFVVDKKKRQIFIIFPWLLLAGYSVLHVFLNAYGIPFLPQAWYRAFWHFPITLGLLIAAMVGYSQRAFASAAKTVGRIFWVFLVVASVAGLGIIYQSGEFGKMIEIIDRKASPSSAYPEAINLVRNQEELDELLPKLTPEWLDPNDRNWRLYESDAQVNIWWNALFDMPLARGYIDAPQPTSRMGQLFLMDQAIAGDGLVRNFDYPEDMAKNMALYYLDWNAVRYFEGGHVSISDNKVPSSYLQDVIAEHSQAETIGLYRLYETKSGKPEIQDVPQYLEYYRFSDDVVTPILSVSNAPAVLFIGDWAGYEALLKVLAMHNLNSRYMVTAFSENNIDSFKLDELKKFDLLIFSNYDYRNQEKAFGMISDYVSQGGKVFIDTGGETRDSENLQLSEFFPFDAMERKGLGSEWDLKTTEDTIFSEVNFLDFSPPLFNETEWKFSYPIFDVEGGVKTLLSQNNKPLLLQWKLGEGDVIWSGLNLAYHVHVYKNYEESKLYVNILKSLVPLEEHPVFYGEPRFESPRRVKFSAAESGKGVLFKEQFYPGWRIKVNGKSSRAYAAGPAFPGYIYIPLDNGGAVEVDFSYWGYWRWYLNSIMSSLVGIVLLDLAIFRGRFLGKRLVLMTRKLKKIVGQWWEKEEEE